MEDMLKKRHLLELNKGGSISYEELSKVYQNYVIFKPFNFDVCFGYCTDLYIYGDRPSSSGVKIIIPQLNTTQDFLLTELTSIELVNIIDLIKLHTKDGS